MSKHDTFWFNDKTGDLHTPKGRMVWPTLLEAKAIKNKPDSRPQFSVTLLIPAKVDLSPIKEAIAEAAESKFGKSWKDKKLLLPLFKSVDEPKFREIAEEFPHFLRCKANADYPPFVYGPDAKLFTGKPSEIYSGRWAVVAGTAYGYDNVSRGVNFGLNRIQLLDHDEPIAGGRVATAEGFDPYDVGGSGSSDGIFD